MTSDRTILKWYWRYHSLYVEVVDWCDTVNEAVRSCVADQESGEAAPVGLEVWNNGDYRYIARNELDALMDAESDRQYTEAMAAPPRPRVGMIQVHPPDGMQGHGGWGQAEWVQYRSYETEDKLAADLEQLRSTLGDERVRRVDPPSSSRA